jgi:hypothetical protein
MGRLIVVNSMNKMISQQSNIVWNHQDRLPFVRFLNPLWWWSQKFFCSLKNYPPNADQSLDLRANLQANLVIIIHNNYYSRTSYDY